MDDLFGDFLHAKRVQSLGAAVSGALEAASLSVTAIGAALAAKEDLLRKHALKQVDRLLSNNGLDDEQLQALWTQYALAEREAFVVALDWTEFDADDQSMICLSQVCSRGRATPLMWKSVVKSELGGERNAHEDELVGRFAEVIPEGLKVTLLAVRGFADQAFYAWLQELGLDYVIRLRSNILVTNNRGECCTARDWLDPRRRARIMRNVTVTGDETPVNAFVSVHDKGMDDPWYLVSSL